MEMHTSKLDEKRPAMETSCKGPMIRKRRSIDMPVNFRIMLVGNNWLRTSKVGNTLLDKEVFEYKDNSSPGKNHSSAFTGYVRNTHTTVVCPADLFASDFTDITVRQRVKECTSLCHPGPHALVLVVDPSDFREQHRRRMEQIMDFFSEQARKHAIVFIYKEKREKIRKLKK
ncbi:GTPase IMAP family member 4-like [Engraulis encrasicolus]|uniref:GTPase IMAP family member 4-like n=1 Tax=Engraulis encrasicolus TaxID=184585 RepID=UPI002FD44821